MQKLSVLLLLFIISFLGCSENDSFSERVQIPDFNFPKTVVFKQNLSEYDIFKDTPSNLIPSDGFHLLELSSVLFTDYAYKQRLVKVPEGQSISIGEENSMNFPDGTILTKTFYYYNDERDTSLGKRVLETRLLIKAKDTWNVATYIWNDEQTDAKLDLEGKDTDVTWINKKGSTVSTNYHIPNENECITCHQSNSSMTPIGTKLRNLNRDIVRDGVSLNLLTHLQNVGVLNSIQPAEAPSIVDYNDLSESLDNRARAYIDMNCAHCHNPGAWEESAKKDFDFSYEVSIRETGILSEKDRIKRLVMNQEMPFIGTTILDQEGVNLMIEFIDNQ
ncbi:MAG: hypothetical protein ACE364_09345 [Chlorobiota bacterium]